MKLCYLPSTAPFLLLALFLPTAGCSSSAGGYESPQAAFDAAKAAMAKGDWKTVCQCMTDESRDQIAAGMAMGGAFAIAFAGSEDASSEKAKAAAEMKEVFEKHGLKDLDKDSEEPPADPNADPKEMMKKLIEPIKDRDQFIADVMPLFKKMSPDQDDPIDPNAKLEDLKIDGDSAKATIVSTKDGAEKKDPIEFKKEASGWKIHMPEN